MNVLWSNSEWIQEHDWTFSHQDRGLLHGLGIFETILAFHGKPILAKEHLHRLHVSAQKLQWKLSIPDLSETMEELLTRNLLTQGHARIRISLSSGAGPLNQLAGGSNQTLWMSANAVTPRTQPISANLSPWPVNDRSPLAGIKSFCYAEHLIALDAARQHGFDETIRINTHGSVCEAALANIFWIKDQICYTPALSCGCLPGITRQFLIDAAPKLNISLREVTAPIRDILQADAAFLSSSIHGITPISQLENHALPIDLITQKFQAAWAHHLALSAGTQK